MFCFFVCFWCSRELGYVRAHRCRPVCDFSNIENRVCTLDKAQLHAILMVISPQDVTFRVAVLHWTYIHIYMYIHIFRLTPKILFVLLRVLSQCEQKQMCVWFKTKQKDGPYICFLHSAFALLARIITSLNWCQLTFKCWALHSHCMIIGLGWHFMWQTLRVTAQMEWIGWGDRGPFGIGPSTGDPHPAWRWHLTLCTATQTHYQAYMGMKQHKKTSSLTAIILGYMKAI